MLFSGKKNKLLQEKNLFQKKLDDFREKRTTKDPFDGVPKGKIKTYQMLNYLENQNIQIMYTSIPTNTQENMLEYYDYRP